MGEVTRFPAEELAVWIQTEWAPSFSKELAREIIRRSPTEIEERDMLMRGRVTKRAKGTKVGSDVGTHMGDRFIKIGPTIREYIGRRALGVHAGEIEDIGKFGWKRRDGTQLETQPFKGRFLYAVEGRYNQPWIIRPRSDRSVLEPEPNIFCVEMLKRAKAYRMVETANNDVLSKAVERLRKAAEGFGVV